MDGLRFLWGGWLVVLCWVVAVRWRKFCVSVEFCSRVRDGPIVTTMGSFRNLRGTIEVSAVEVVFVLFKSIYGVSRVMDRVGRGGGMTVMRLSLVKKLDSGSVSISFVGRAAGTSKVVAAGPGLVGETGRLSLCAVLEFFLVSSVTLRGIFGSRGGMDPSVVRILPNMVPGVVGEVSGGMGYPLVTKKLVYSGRSVVGTLSTNTIYMSSAGRSA